MFHPPCVIYHQTLSSPTVTQACVCAMDLLQLLLIGETLSALLREQPNWSLCELLLGHSCTSYAGSVNNKNKGQTLGAVTSEKPRISDLFSGVLLESLCPSPCDSFQFSFWCVIIWWFVFLSAADRVRRTRARLIFIHQFNPRALFNIWHTFRHSTKLEMNEVISIIAPISIDK